MAGGRITHDHFRMNAVGFARFVFGAGEACAEDADGAGGDTGHRFDFGFGEAAGELGVADVEATAGAPEHISLR